MNVGATAFNCCQTMPLFALKISRFSRIAHIVPSWKIATKAFQNPRIPMYTEQNYLALINAWLGWIINFGYLNEKIIEEENAHKIQQDNVTVEMSPLGSGNFGSVWKVNFYDNWQC